jgi:hypothetical protein
MAPLVNVCRGNGAHADSRQAVSRGFFPERRSFLIRSEFPISYLSSREVISNSRPGSNISTPEPFASPPLKALPSPRNWPCSMAGSRRSKNEGRPGSGGKASGYELGRQRRRRQGQRHGANARPSPALPNGQASISSASSTMRRYTARTRSRAALASRLCSSGWSATACASSSSRTPAGLPGICVPRRPASRCWSAWESAREQTRKVDQVNNRIFQPFRLTNRKRPQERTIPRRVSGYSRVWIRALPDGRFGA